MMLEVQEHGLEQKSPQANRCPGCDSQSWELLLKAPDRFHGRDELFELLRCTNCRLTWLHNAPKAEDMWQHYGTAYDKAISQGGDSSPEHWRGRNETLAKYKACGNILDLGCSSGSFLSSLPAGKWNLFGIEMSAEVAKKAKDRCGVDIFVGDILDADFPEASFDAITCFHVFEHLYRPKEILKRVSYWLKPGGIFYTIMPNIDSAAAHVFKSYWYALELPRHLFHYSPASLAYLANAVGLKTTSLRTEREVFFEQSSRYILDDTLKKIGIKRQPLATAPAPGLPFRILRKAFRMTALPVIRTAIGFAGDRESIHAIFSK